MRTKENNLALEKNKWFATYKGWVYANFPTDINSRINNKQKIDAMYYSD